MLGVEVLWSLKVDIIIKVLVYFRVGVGIGMLFLIIEEGIGICILI